MAVDGHESAIAGLRVEDVRRSIDESRADNKAVPADRVFSTLEARMKGMARRPGA